MSRLLATTLLVVASALAARADGPEPIDLGSRRELFLDRYLIDSLSRLELRLHRPVDRGPVLAFDKPWEGPFCGYVTILHPGEKYQAFYRAMGPGGVKKDADADQVVCYAESADGVHWTRPSLTLFPRQGEPATNIVLANAGSVTHNFAPFLDSRPDVPPDERYKAVGGTRESGLIAHASPDGIHWKRLRDQPVFTSREAQVHDGKDDYVFDSQNVAFWSIKEQRYLLYFRIFQEGQRRIARTESNDFITWKKPTLMEYRRDGQPAPIEQLYTSQTHPYFRAPQIYVATAARFMAGRQAITEQQAKAIGVDPGYFHDVSDAVLMTSRGGNTYDRTFMEAFVSPGVGAENWTSRTNYPARNVVQTGPAEMSVYLNQNYGQPTAHLRRYSLRLDGFASIHADYDGGEMITKPLTFQGPQLLLNFATSAAGGLKVEIQKPDGTPIPGFLLADCDELIGNEVERAVSFKGSSLDGLAGQPVRLRFAMRDADLFSLRFSAPGSP